MTEDSLTPKEERRRPLVASEEDMANEISPKKGRFDLKSGGLVPIIVVCVIVSALVFVAMGMVGGGSFLTKQQFEANFAGLEQAVNETIESANAKQKEMNTTIQNLSGNITSQVNSAISVQLAQLTSSLEQTKTGLTTLQNSLKDYVKNDSVKTIDSQIVTINQKIKEATDSITALNTSASTYVKQSNLADYAKVTALNDYAKLATIEAINKTVTGIEADIASLNTELTKLSNTVKGLPDLSALQASINTMNVNLTNTIADINAKIVQNQLAIAKIETDIALLKAQMVTTTTTPTTTTTTTSGDVSATFYNSPMIFKGYSSSVTSLTRSFGIKLVNNVPDKDLTHVSITVTMTISDLANFTNYTLTSPNGTFNWIPSLGLGNTMTFTADGYLYVPKKNGEWSELQNLTLTRADGNAGTFVTTVNSIVINSKTLQ